MDDEIKRTGLESLVPEELENHLIFNSNRLRTFEDARSEIVTYAEEKFGLRIRDFKPSKVEFCKRSDPSMLVWSALSCRAKEGGHQIRAMGVLRAMQHILTRPQCKQEHVQANVWQRQSKQVMVQE